MINIVNAIIAAAGIAVKTILETQIGRLEVGTVRFSLEGTEDLQNNRIVQDFKVLVSPKDQESVQTPTTDRKPIELLS